MTGVASGVPDATVIRVTASLSSLLVLAGVRSPQDCVVPVSGFCCAALKAKDCFVLVSAVAVLPQSLRTGLRSPLSVLAEVLPRSAMRLFRATVVLPLWFDVCRLVGLRSGEVLPEQLLALLVESAWALSVKVSCPWLCVWMLRWLACLVSHSGLVSAVGVWLAVLLVEASVLHYGFPSRRGRDSLRESLSSTFVGLLKVVMLHCGVVSPGCASESLWLSLPMRQSRCSVFWCVFGADVVVVLLMLSAFRVLPCGSPVSCGESFLLARGVVSAAGAPVLQLFTFGVSPSACDSTLCCAVCLIVALSVVHQALVVASVPVFPLACGASAQAGYPFPLSLLFFPFPLFSGGGGLPCGESGRGGAGGLMAVSWAYVERGGGGQPT
ncbi:hypothetical protein Taro_044142 [Colocasia esculenta]|uniref:Uncharacterized protein n=1 Tax=Colocasia esculenta TaxID=4460 RepID=A0A843X243_COLES|nr:hypothetical protein [Colocasia esculenta]